MLKRLYRQRRRIALLALLFGLAVLVESFSHTDLRYAFKHEINGPVWLLGISMVLAMLIIVVAVSVVVICIFPSLRRTVEAGFIAAVLTEGVRSADAILPAWALEGWAVWIWFMGFFYLVSYAVERNWFFSMGLRLRFRTQNTRVINASPDAIWAALAPDAATLETYWTKTLSRVEPRPDVGPDAVEARYRMGPGLSLVQTHTRRIWQRPLHLLYDFHPTDVPDAAPGIRGSFEMTCVPQSDGRTRLTMTHEYPSIGFGTWLLIWLDDLGGCEMDAVQARLTGRRDWSLSGWAARKMACA